MSKKNVTRVRALHPTQDCILAEGLGGDGYGTITINNKQFRLHRYIYSLYYPGPYLPNTVIRHTCDTPNCINPLHLLSGTYADNTRDMVERGRNVSHKGEKHGRARLTEQDVREIRDLWPMYNQREIAKLYGIKRPTVGDITRRKNWKHVV